MVPENIHTPPTDWNFLRGGGFYETKKLKEMNETLLEFPERWAGVSIKFEVGSQFEKSRPWY